jgi:hypothetical protein
MPVSRKNLGHVVHDEVSVRRDFSVCIRAASAALLACAILYVVLLFFQQYLPQFQWNMNDAYDLDAARKQCDFCKKAFYGSFFLAVPTSAAVAVYFSAATSGSIILSMAAIVATYFSLHFGSDLRSFGTSCLALCFSLICIGINRRANVRFDAGGRAEPYRLVGWLDVLSVAFLWVLLVPTNLEAVNVLNDAHKVSYFIGPALYQNAPALVPGLDFHSHYGLAIGWVFHFLMGDGWKSAGEHAVGLNIAITLAVYLQAYFLLSYLIRSKFASLVIVASLAVLAFSTDHHFYSPSAYPTRFPLLIIFAVALGAHCRAPDRLIWLIASAILAAASLMWETETGIFFFVAGCTTVLVAGGFPKFRNTLVFASIAIGATILACLSLYGPRILSLAFVTECLRPLLLYGAGWGSVPIKWGLSWDLVYNFPLQLAGCLTIGWAAVHLSRRDDERLDFERGILLALSLIGIALLIKWVNRSYDAVWHQNALPLVIVLAWWVSRFSSLWHPTIKLVAGLLSIVGTLLALLFVQDVGNPTLYGLRSYAHYPSLLNLPFMQAPVIQWQQDFSRITATETAFIRQKTGPDDRVLVLAFIDWAYLAQAHRAPKAFFLPLIASFDDNFIERSFEGADILFYDPIVESYDQVPQLAGTLKVVKRDFVPVETQGNLTLYRRTTNFNSNPSDAGRQPR